MSGRGYKTVAARKDDKAGTLSGDGRYFDVYFERKLIRVHNVVAKLHGLVVPRGYIVDHEDGNSLNNNISNLRVITQLRNCHNRAKQVNNTSGCVGVTKKVNKLGHSYWVARWQQVAGKRGTRTFSVALYGDNEAFILASKYRAIMIEELNKLGHGYTERHGK